MGSKKAFIFSTDAFIAFSITLVALYSLIFFLAVPYNYYNALMQAQNLARDSLDSLSALPSPNTNSPQSSALGYLAFVDDESIAENYFDSLIPPQFNYIFEKETGGTWEVIASKNSNPYKKLRAVAYSVVFDYESEKPDNSNPFGYNTCYGTKTPCDLSESSYKPGDFKVVLVRLVVYA